MTDDEIIEVVTAHKEGKQIQWSHRGKNQWYDFVNQPEWNFTEYLFRVKPEPRKPREWWILPNRSVHEVPRIELVHEYPCEKYVHVREVIEE